MAATASGGLKPFYLAVGAIALIGGGVIAYRAATRTTVSIPANVTVTAADTAGFRGYVLGEASAPVEVTEYADYQCPACAGFESVQFPDVKERLIATGKVRWRYRDFPLEQHQHARTAAHAAACAHDQGKFWEVHRMIYEAQADWAVPGADAAGQFRSFAKSAGVELGAYDACMEAARYAGRIQASAQEGVAAGVSSTPTFLIGGRLYPGSLPYDAIRRIVDSLAAAAAPAAPAN